METKSSVPIMPARRWAISITTNASHAALVVRLVLFFTIPLSLHILVFVAFLRAHAVMCHLSAPSVSDNNNILTSKNFFLI